MSENRNYDSGVMPVYEAPLLPPPVIQQPYQPYVPPNLPLILPNVYTPPPVPAGNGDASASDAPSADDGSGVLSNQ